MTTLSMARPDSRERSASERRRGGSVEYGLDVVIDGFERTLEQLRP
jgi:hypothetical protein